MDEKYTHIGVDFGNQDSDELIYTGSIYRFFGEIKCRECGEMVIAHEVSLQPDTEPECPNCKGHVK